MYHDHHLHPFGYAALVNGLELMDAPDLDTVMRRVAEHGERVEGAIVGQRLNDEGVREMRLPTASDIDDVVRDRPVLLYRYCGHIAVANSAVMGLYLWHMVPVVIVAHWPTIRPGCCPNRRWARATGGLFASSGLR